jgi:hypothetical protein
MWSIINKYCTFREDVGVKKRLQQWLSCMCKETIIIPTVIKMSPSLFSCFWLPLFLHFIFQKRKLLGLEMLVSLEPSAQQALSIWVPGPRLPAVAVFPSSLSVRPVPRPMPAPHVGLEWSRILAGGKSCLPNVRVR